MISQKKKKKRNACDKIAYMYKDRKPHNFCQMNSLK